VRDYDLAHRCVGLEINSVAGQLDGTVVWPG